MTKEFETLEVILLPTNEPSLISKHIKDNEFCPYHGFPYSHNGEIFQNQHLYLVSNSETKEGDWGLFLDADNKWFKRKCEGGEVERQWYHKKIEATTDIEILNDKCNGIVKEVYEFDDYIYKCDKCNHKWLAAIENSKCGEELNLISKIPISFIKDYINANGDIKEVTFKIIQ